MVDFQNPQTRTVLITLVFGGLLIALVFIIAFLPKEVGPSLVTPTPILTAPTPFVEEVIYEDDRMRVVKLKDKYYEATVKDKEVSEKEVRELAKLNSDDKIVIIIENYLLPPLNIDEKSQQELENSLDDFNKRRDAEFNPADWGLNPNHAE